MLMAGTIAVVLALMAGLHAQETGRRHALPSFGVGAALLLGLVVLALNHEL